MFGLKEVVSYLVLVRRPPSDSPEKEGPGDYRVAISTDSGLESLELLKALDGVPRGERQWHSENRKRLTFSVSAPALVLVEKAMKAAGFSREEKKSE